MGFRECPGTTIERKRWSKHHQNSSRVAAGYESPAPNSRVKCNKYASPVVTTRILTHTLQPLKEASRAQKRDVESRPGFRNEDMKRGARAQNPRLEPPA